MTTTSALVAEAVRTRCLGVTDCADDAVARVGQVALDRHAPDGVVVDDHHADRPGHALAPLSGTTSSTTVPSPGADVMLARPPTSVIRRVIEWATPAGRRARPAAGGPARCPRRRRGPAEVGRTFQWVASRFSDCTAYEFDLVAAGASGDLAYTVGYERSSVSVDGGPVRDNVVRLTRIYRRESGDWKIVHRHGDHPPVDESPAAAGDGL
jgi:ketosteroid isomerase-like protein